MADAAEPSGFSADELAVTLHATLRPSPTGYLLAVSGGPDSICLMHLLAALQKRPDHPPIAVAVVDHGLRPESREEAGFVVAEAERIGLPAQRLVWEGPKPTRAIQERARAVRYRLLVAHCLEIGASHLLTAHTLDDQAETVLLRLSRGSGPGGLAAMRALTSRAGVMHARPLLGVPKARLLERCRAEGWDYRVDPSNADPRFARARVRRLMPALEAEGVTTAGLARLAVRAGRAEDALRAAAAALARDLGVASMRGTVCLDAGDLARQPDELVLRVLALVVAKVGRPDPPRLERLERMTAAFQLALAERTPFRHTLQGAVLTLSPEGKLGVVAEAERRRGRA